MRKNFLIPAVLVALVIGAILTVRGSSNEVPKPAPTHPLRAFYAQTPTWTDCGDGFQCTTINVPLDYANPGGKSISIALNRLPATNQSRRLGSLLVNPGGPGGSGLDYARGANQIVSDSILERYDLVGFDPRGVGQSSPIRCLSDREEDQVAAIDQSPNDKYEMETLVFAAKLLGQRCKEVAGDSLAFMGSEEVARDMDVMRAVLGDKKLNYLGKSYGTYLGAIYADLFPKKVGRLVLDGAVDPNLTESQVGLAQAVGFETALDAFAKNCVRFEGCPIGNSAKDVRAKVAGFVAQLDRYPLKTDETRRLTQSLGILGIVSALYDQEYGWPILEEGLSEGFSGDGTILLNLADQYLDRDENGKYLDNSNDIAYIVGCHDRRGDVSVAQSKKDAYQFSKVAPIFGPYLAWSMLPCEYWPVKPDPYRAPIRARGANPVLVVGTIRDPATPYKWAQSLATQMTSARLLTWNGDGHTAYARGSACIDSSVDSYLLYGALPPSGKTCR